MFTRKPKYKIGTLLRDNQAEGMGDLRLEQLMIVDIYTIMGQIRTHEGLVVQNEVPMYKLMYLGDGGRMVTHTAKIIEDMVHYGKWEIAAAPD